LGYQKLAAPAPKFLPRNPEGNNCLIFSTDQLQATIQDDRSIVLRLVNFLYIHLAPHGATGMAIEDPVDCGRILERALETPGPVIVEAMVDPFTPPMPAKITLDQTKKSPNRSLATKQSPSTSL
jgi:hypothetical protein